MDEQEERYQSVTAIRDDIAQDIAIGLHQITKYGQQIIEANKKAKAKN